MFPLALLLTLVDVLAAIWSSITSLEIMAVIAILMTLFAFFEKIFDKEFIGRRLFRLIWSIARFFCRWACYPFRQHIDKVSSTVKHLATMGDKLDKIIVDDNERDTRRTEELSEIKESVNVIRGEVELNGGGSMKDAVVRLLRHDENAWRIMNQLSNTLHLTNLRLDIMDDADKRMSFQLAPTLECTWISQSFLRFFGYTEKDMIGSDWDFCIGETDKQTVMTKWAKASEKRAKYQHAQMIVDSDGTQHACIVRGYPRFAEDEFIGFYGTVEVVADKNSVHLTES